MQPPSLLKLLEGWQAGSIPLEEVERRMAEAIGERHPHAIKTDDAHVDLDRAARCGYPEVVYAAGKTTRAIIDIFDVQQQRGQSCLATRVSEEQAEGILARFPQLIHNPTGRTIRSPDTADQVSIGDTLVVTAGTSDRPVAEEAVETLKWMGCGVELIGDVGVAGPHRLGDHRQRLQSADAIVVAAGMEGALPSVVGGWVSCPVIAVPTSVGYGASFQGVAALLGMLNSCAANVTVVNIDAGFKAGYVAGLICRRVHRMY
ncbi:MAG: nickel pincer cofactor biosynthesis protein LarB [Planctomycetota bacterium]|nr:nickel pincer cofactor biosynthesis protein LarB [Planctomycetota bacterium]MDA1212174.1 nickel pincer cofactor biosynthesis protein LarB [Planctomycetota bacterium]